MSLIHDDLLGYALLPISLACDALTVAPDFISSGDNTNFAPTITT